MTLIITGDPQRTCAAWKQFPPGTLTQACAPRKSPLTSLGSWQVTLKQVALFENERSNPEWEYTADCLMRLQ